MSSRESQKGSPGGAAGSGAQDKGQGQVSRLLQVMLQATEQRIPHFRGRAKRVAEIACELGKTARLSDSELSKLRLAGIFHDIGYIGVSDKLINSPEGLGEEEKREIDKHLHYGGQVLASVYPHIPEVSEAVWYHHERVDGRGPFGLKGDETPLFGRIIAVAEAIESMTSTRAHRPDAKTHESTLAELRAGAGMQFDSRIVMLATQLGARLFGWLARDQHEWKSPPEPASTSAMPLAESVPDEAPATPSEQAEPAQGADEERSGPVLDRRQLMNQLRRSLDLKAMPAVLHHVMSMTSSARVSIHQVADAVKQDQAISLKILKLANSALYARGAPLQDIQRAVLRLGFQAVREMVMGLSVITQFGPRGADAEGLDRRDFWEHSLVCGVIARDLVRACHSGDPERAFTTGLLHDVGRIVLDEFFTDQYRQVRRFARQHQLPLEWAELKLLSMTHADASQELLGQWRFPSLLIAPIAGHHLSLGNMKRYVPGEVESVAIVALANRLAHAMVAGCSGNETIYPIDELAMELGFKEEMIRFVARNAVDRVNDIKFTIIGGSDSQVWRPHKEIMTERLGMGVNPLSVKRFAGPDSFELLFDQISPSKPELPNLALVHLRRREDIVPCGEQLLGAEKQVGVDKLPVITLCTTGQELALLPKALGGRAHAVLRVPTDLGTLIETVRRLVRAGDGWGEPVTDGAGSGVDASVVQL